MSVFDGRGSRVDILGISEEMRQAVRLWESVYCVIINPGANNVNLTTKNNAAFLWHGLARYQPYRKDIPVAQVTNPTTTATARFQIDFGMDGALPDIKTNYHVWIVPVALANQVLSADEQLAEYPDPFVSQYLHVVTSSMNSSMAWIRTVETILDTKTRASYEIQADGSNLEWIP